MGERTVIPFGPQHPVLLEPLHLDLVIEDEKVVKAMPSWGFVHRGLEKLAEKRDFIEFSFVAERICGVCSHSHGMAYTQAIEALMSLEIPVRAKYLRTILAEFSRINSHLLWLGLFANALGFESLFMHCWKLREKILDIVEETTGGRVIFGACRVGGVNRDIDAPTLARMSRLLTGMEKGFREIDGVFRKDYTVQKRLKETGALSRADAHLLGVVGPVAKGSGIPCDMRRLGYSVYNELDFQPVVETEGDSYARTSVRIKEIFQSVGLIQQAIAKVPAGEVSMKITGLPPAGEHFEMVEQPRGEAVYYVKGNGTRFLERFRVRNSTFANIPALLKILEGCELSDVPMLILSIDPCISCAER